MTSKLYITLTSDHTSSTVSKLGLHICRKTRHALEKVQRRATKMVKGLKKLSYETRLKRLGIYTPERRRLRDDLIETFKILTGKERIDFFKKFFELAYATSWLRGHSLKLYKPRCHTTWRQNCFSIRVINELNKLPQSVIEAPSVNAFKNRLEKYWSDMGDYSWHGYTTHQPQVQVQVQVQV